MAQSVANAVHASLRCCRLQFECRNTAEPATDCGANPDTNYGADSDTNYGADSDTNYGADSDTNCIADAVLPGPLQF
jgi:hypothetical protein